MKTLGKTNIPYGDRCLNVVWGCTPISAGCDHCYAQAFLKRMGRPQTVTIDEEALNTLTFPKEPSRILVGFQTDLWHPDVPGEVLWRCVRDAGTHPEHRFLFLTKRSGRLREWTRIRQLCPPDNCWFGVTVESPDYLHRIDDLLAANVPHRWVSVEPILSPVDIFAHGTPEWVVIGKENGAGARPYEPAWVQNIVDFCRAANIPVYVKPGTETLDGQTYHEYPAGLLLPGEAHSE